MRPSLSIIISFVLALNCTFAQKFDLGSWNILNLKYNHNEKWSAFGEAQLRSLKLYRNFHYYEYKGGINYKVNKNVNLTLGAGSYQTYKEGETLFCQKIMMNFDFGLRSYSLNPLAS